MHRATTSFLSLSLLLPLLLALSACGGGGGDGGGGGPQQSNLFSGGATVGVGGSTSLSDVALVDLNADGALDLAVVSETSGNLSIALGQGQGGSGNFGVPFDVAVGGDLTAVASGDFDADGDVDLAVTDVAGDRVVVLTNDGNANFSLSGNVALAGGSDPSDVIAVDVNADGELDLLVSNEGTSSVSVALGVVGSVFLAPTNLSLAGGIAATEMVSGDFDADGDLDLAVSSGANGSVQILLLDGAGPVVTSTTTVVVDAGVALSGLVTGDFNEDGRIDLAVVEATTGEVHVLLGTGSGTFALGGEFDTAADASGLVAGDFDLDGHLDLAVGTGNRISVILGNGNGTFDAAVDFAASGNTAISLAVGDLDCDGSADIVNVNTISGNVGVLLGADHSISLDLAAGATTTATVGTEPSDVELVDLNGDGELDLVVADALTGTILVSLGLGNGTFAAPTSVSAGIGVEAEALVTGDFDGDGDLDVVATLGVGAAAAVLLGDGSGALALSLTTIATGAGTTPDDVAAGDFDLDGDLDVAIAADGNVAVSLGNGDGTFAAATNLALSAGAQASAVVVGDWDQDGALDLAVSSSTTGTVDVFFGNGDGTFAAALTVNVDAGANLAGMVAADFDCDGELDLAVVNATDGTVHVLLNANGTFTLGTTLAAQAGASAIAAADLDHDGDVELIVTSDASGQLSVLAGNANGTFAAAVSFATSATGSVAVDAADLNGDGRIDVVVANDADANASVLLNAGT